MESSKILNKIYEIWLTIIKWYESGAASKILKKIYSAISNTWMCSILVGYFCEKNEDKDSKTGIIYKIFYLPFAFLSLFASAPLKKLYDKLKESFLYKSLYCIANNLIAASTRFIGVLLLSALLVYMIALRSFTNPLLLAGIIISLLLCIWDFSLLRALSHSIVKALMKIFLSTEPTFDYYDETQLTCKYRLITAAVFGIILGFTASVSPIIALGLAGVLVVLFNVELGIAITIFAIPFIPTMLCAALAMLCFFAVFLKKCALGDREWKLDKVGLALIFFMLVIFICSLTSVARSNSMQICVLYFALMSFYFTIVNTIKTRSQLYSLLTVFLAAAFFVAAYGIIQYVFGLDMDKQVWVDTEMFSDIKMRAFSTLENPNVLGEYLLLTIPVGIAMMWCAKKFWTKFFWAGVSAVMLLCLVLTMSRGCWIGILFAAAIFITFVDGRYWSLGILALCLMPTILPASILNRFLSIGDLGDTSSSYRLMIWIGSVAMLKDFWLVGIGPGTQAYNLIYPRYSYPEITAPHAHNVYLQQMIETGVVGLCALIAVMFSFFRQMAQNIRALSKKSADRIMSIAISSGVAGFMLQGVFDYVFYNYRVFMMLWMFIAFGSVLCAVSTSDTEEDKN